MLRAAFIHDPNWDDDNELDAVKLAFDNRDLLKDVEFVVDGMTPLELDNVTGIDLVVLDYGGMSMLGAHDTALSNVRYMCEWADNHPGSIVLIWTYYTLELYNEVVEEFRHLNNVKVVSVEFSNAETGWVQEVKDWFGLQG